MLGHVLTPALLATLAILLSPGAPRAGDPPPVPATWESEVAAGHPLVATLWDVADGRRTEPRDLARAAARAEFVLLGEKHDNPDHHRLQAWIIEAMAAAGARPAVAFEMIDRDRAPALRRHLAANPGDAAGLGAAVDWESRGWPAWDIYRPVAEAALAAGLPIRAGDVAFATQRRTGREGLAALPAKRRRTLALDRDLDPALRDSLREDLVESHCNKLPPAALEPMMSVQRLRDAVMADSLIAAAREAGGAVLIAGNGHVRADRGVPWYLRARLDAPKVLTVAILEVVPDEPDWRAHLPAAPPGAAPPFDYVWFTPRLDDRDPCAAFADQLEKLDRPDAGHGASDE